MIWVYFHLQQDIPRFLETHSLVGGKLTHEYANSLQRDGWYEAGKHQGLLVILGGQKGHGSLPCRRQYLVWLLKHVKHLTGCIYQSEHHDQGNHDSRHGVEQCDRFKQPQVVRYSFNAAQGKESRKEKLERETGQTRKWLMGYPSKMNSNLEVSRRHFLHF